MVWVELRVGCEDRERAGWVGQRQSEEPAGHREDFAMSEASHGSFPSALASPLMLF